MSKPVPPSGQRGPGASASSPGQLLEALKRGGIGRLLPVPGEIQASVGLELRKRHDAEPAEPLADDLANLSILRNHATLYERRWQERLAQRFEGWPRPAARSAADDAYALVSEEELQSQLVGQPVIEALDRRFTDVLDVIDSRLWSFAAELGAQVRPTNPIGPRAIVESFLETFPASECNTSLRQALLRQLERLAGERFGELYAWFNTQLSEAGFAMARAGDFAMLMASPLAGLAAPTQNVSDARRELWSQDNALDARDSSWREGKRSRRRATTLPTHAAERGNALRRHVRALRLATQPADAAPASPARELRNEEFLAVLSLLQGDAEGMRDAGASASGLGARLREHLRQGAARLGMERASTQFSAEQEDAIDLTGVLFDHLLATHVLGADATELLERVCCPYLCLVLSDPGLFDDAGHPAHAWLSLLIEQWDANQGESEHDAEAHALAEDSAEEVIADYHGDAAVFEDALEALRVALEPRRGRADIAERRTWQSIQGRERLQAARRDADAALAQRLQGRMLLASVAGFLDDQWRQSLIHAWLREGPQSERYRAALAVGDAMVGIDQAAAQAQGSEVAEGLFALQPPLRDCYVACGLDENAANDLLAALVADLSRPDATRDRHVSTPLAEQDDPSSTAAIAGDASLPSLPVGQMLVATEPGKAPMALRVAWVSPLSAQHLLVNRQGARQWLLSPAEIAAMRHAGRLHLRSPDGAIEGALQALAGTATGSLDEDAPPG